MHAFFRAMAVLPLLLPAIVTSVSAQDFALAEILGRCRADAYTFCRDIPPGDGRIAACLYGRLKDLSPECRNVVAQAAAIRACERDYHRFCEGVQPGEGRIVACLNGAWDHLSRHCRDMLDMVSGRDLK